MSPSFNRTHRILSHAIEVFCYLHPSVFFNPGSFYISRYFPSQDLPHLGIFSILGSFPSQDLLHLRIFSISIVSICDIPPKGKGKVKEIATRKRLASTHDLRKVSTTVVNARVSSKFSAVIKFSAGCCKDTPAWEIAEVMTTDKQYTEEGESSKALEDSPAQSAIGSPKVVGGSPAGTLTIVSELNLSGRPVADSEQGTSGGSPLVTSISKGNVESATLRPQESLIIHKYPRNGLMQKGEKATI